VNQGDRVRIIVDNHSSFTVILARESAKEEHLRAIAQGLDLDYNDLLARVRRVSKQPKYVPIVIKDELTPGDLAFVDSHHDFFPELVLIQAQRRLYPQNGVLAHVIGYTGEISEQELDLPEFAKYNQGEMVGKFGIEKQYNDSLMGVDGQRQVVVDNRGQVRQTRNQTRGRRQNLQLTIGRFADRGRACDGWKERLGGSARPRSGEVRVVSRPTFDPNKFTVGSRPRTGAKSPTTDHPLLNRAIQAERRRDPRSNRWWRWSLEKERSTKNGRTFRRRGVVRQVPALLSGSRGTGLNPCTAASYTLATYTFIRWARNWGSTIWHSTGTWWASASLPESTCRMRRRG
jgi:cell division protein FtsI/penicillin-binding protein 2